LPIHLCTVVKHCRGFHLARRLVAAGAVLAVWLFAGTLLAQPSVAELSERLSRSADFRVRTQAALALGATGDKAAVSPLCSALEDPNATVRAASAAALGRLVLGGEDCLEERLEDEASGSVKSVIEKAIARIRSGGGPVLSEASRYYVAIAETTDKTGRKKGEVHAMVRAAMASAAGQSDGYALAPDGETPQQAKQVLSKFKKLQPFYVWPKVSPPEYGGGNLMIRLEISVFTYPGKALKGTIPLKLTMPDVRPGDTESENDLIRMAASKVFEKFVANAARFE
jgi:hypothetical protein